MNWNCSPKAGCTREKTFWVPPTKSAVVENGASGGRLSGSTLRSHGRRRIEFEQLLAARANLSGQRHHGALDALVEAKAILSCVVEAFALAEGEVAIVRKARVGGHLRPQRHQLVVDLFQGVFVFQTARGHLFPDLLAQGAVGLLEDLGGLLQSHLGAVDADGHCAHQLVVVLGQQLVLRFKRNIFFAEQRDRIGGFAIQHGVALLRQLCAIGTCEVGFLSLLHQRLDPRNNLFDKFLIGSLAHRIVGLRSHGDVALAALLAVRRGKLGVIGQPLLELPHGRRMARQQLLEQRLDLRPVAHVGVLRHELARERPLQIDLNGLH